MNINFSYEQAAWSLTRFGDELKTARKLYRIAREVRGMADQCASLDNFATSDKMEAEAQAIVKDVLNQICDLYVLSERFDAETLSEEERKALDAEIDLCLGYPPSMATKKDHVPELF